MQTTIKATILYKPTEDNPNNRYEYLGELIDGRQKFSDTYYIDEDRYDGINQAISYIVNDLKIVASGGYDNDKTHDEIFKISYSVYNFTFRTMTELYEILRKRNITK